MAALDDPQGCVVVGTEDADGAVTAVTVAAGTTLLTSPLPVPNGAGAVSFEIRAVPDGTATLSVKVRSGNRPAATLVDRAIISPTGFVSFSASASAIVAAAADANYVQLEIACSGADVDVIVYGAARETPPPGQVTVSGSVSLSGALAAGNNNIGDVDVASIAAGNNNIGDVDVASLPGTVAADIAATSASNTLIKTAVEALQTSNAGTGLKTQLTAAGGLTDLAAVNTSNAAIQTSNGLIQTATQALAALISGGVFLVGGTILAAIKTATEALAAIISGGRLLVTSNATLQAGAAAVGTVGVTSVALASSVYDVDEKTDLSTSAFQLASHVNTYGTRISNTSSNGNVVTVGGTTVTGARFIARIYAGQDCWFEVTNSNLLYVYGSASSTRFTYGGY